MQILWQKTLLNVGSHWSADGGWWISTLLTFIAACGSMWVVIQSYRDKPRVDWRFRVTGYLTWKDVRLWNVGDATATNVQGTVSFGWTPVLTGNATEFFIPRISPGDCVTFRIGHRESDLEQVTTAISYLSAPVRNRRWRTLTLNLRTGDHSLSRGQQSKVSAAAVQPIGIPGMGD